MLTSRICNRLIEGDVMMILCLVMKISLFYNSGNVTIQYIFLRTKFFFSIKNSGCNSLKMILMLLSFAFDRSIRIKSNTGYRK